MRPALLALILLLAGCETAQRLTGTGEPEAEDTAAVQSGTDASQDAEAASGDPEQVDAEEETAGQETEAEPGALAPLARTVEDAQKGKDAPEEDDGKPLAVAEDAEGCGAGARQDLLGKTTKDLTGYRYPVGTRFIAPGMAVTRDLRPGRLNIEYNRLGIVTKVWCG